MLAVLLDGKGGVELKEVSRPKPGSNEILVRMEACGLCGTDVEKIRGEYTASMAVIGHEPAGVVEEVGEEVKELKIGDRVFVHHHVPCLNCWYCRHGSETMCPSYKATNISPGGFSEYFLVPSENIQKGGVLKLPQHVSFDQGSLIEPLACCIRGLSRADADNADRVLVVGCGPVGQMHIRLLANKGKEIMAADINEKRLEAAIESGSTYVLKSDEAMKKNVLQYTDGIGADLAVVASGNQLAIMRAIECTRKGGKVLIFGVPAKGSMIELDFSSIFNSEISFVTSYGATDRETRIALGMIASGELSTDNIITHHYGLGEFKEALQTYYSGAGMKIVITS
ncbi:MAG: alcohol dehydrogenase catalytic domain-containing protein [Conexivisphaerales archaeon]